MGSETDPVCTHNQPVTASSRLRTVADIEDFPCQALVELVTDYVEGRLASSTRARFEAHLAQCSGCRTYLEQMRQTIRTLGRLPAESIEPEARDGLLEVFRDWTHSARFAGERDAQSIHDLPGDLADRNPRAL
jgi:hypothetical protein